MSGWGQDEWGVSAWGSVYTFGDISANFGSFDFLVVADSVGYNNRITLSTPAPADSPSWGRRYRILRKRSEWPQAPDDSGAVVIADEAEPGAVSKEYLDEDLIAGENYYYRMFLEDAVAGWVSSIYEQDSAYPYGRWGSGEAMYQRLPRGWRSADVSGDLRNFMEIFGALVDDIKTDCEYLMSLFRIDEVHEDLIAVADSKVGWPTWLTAGGIQKRADSERAVGIYGYLGNEQGYQLLIEGVTDWDVAIAQGWRYIMWSNNPNCTTPDLSNPDLRADIRGINDPLKYTNDASRWQSFTGLGFFLTEILGVSGELTSDMWSRILELLEWGAASYAVWELRVSRTFEETYSATDIIDSWEDPLWSYIEGVEAAVDDALTPTANVSTFITNSAASTTNTTSDRVPHFGIEYL